jgi:uncharacterized protein YjdB
MKTKFYLIFSISVLFLFGSRVAHAQCFTWGNAGPQAFSGGGAIYTSITTDASGVPYVAYMDGANGDKITVRKFTGGSWNVVGAAGFSVGRADYTSIAISNTGVPYVAYMDESSSYKVTVKKFNGVAWETVGLVGFSPGKAEYISIAIDGTGVPYVAFTDWANGKKTSVMKFNGSMWVSMGTLGFSAGQASYTKLALNNAGIPHVVFKDQANGDKASVMKFTGGLWGYVGSAGLSADGADYTSITILNDTVMVAYADLSISRKVVAKKYIGSTWVTAGTAGFSPDRADYISLTKDAGGIPYVGYTDWFNGDETTVMRLINGDWETVGSSNFSPGSASYMSIAVSAGNVVYAAYTDGDMGGGASVMKFDYAIAPITGNFVVCAGSAQPLSSFTTGGTWSSSNTSVATVDATSGVVTGNAPGTATITYTVTGGCGTVSTMATVTVNPSPAVITGTMTTCTGSTTTLASATTGGTWISLTPGVATINTSGVVTGIVAGTTIITYSIPGGCAASATVTVYALPSFITGPTTVCMGASGTLTSATTGGVWSSSNTTNATIGSSSGIVNGLAAGTTTISYMTTGGCYRTYAMTVNTTPPAITGPSAVCATANIPLSNTVSGGIWTSSNTAIATVVSSSGIVVGVAPGTATITYNLAGGCNATTTVTVNVMPSAITGASTVCVGSTALLSSSPAGGNWSSSNTTQATVTSGGLVTGLAAGSPDIVYSFPTGCSRTLHFNVGPSPSAITGPLTICEGANGTVTSYPAGGLWSSSGTNVSIGSATGGVTGITAGTATIIYTLGAGCQQTAVVTVIPSPSPISGPTSICMGASVPFTSSAGGTWTSGNPGLAIVGSSTGIVTGVAPGALFITYTIPSGCLRTTAVTVTSTPAAAVVTGGTVLCTGATTALSASITGGIWSITTGKVSVSTSGVVTGVASGVDTVRYNIPTVCGLITTSHAMTVNAAPSAGTIIGASEVCKGSTIPLSSTVAGGTWKSSNITLAVVSAGGVVTGILAGTVTISYRVSNTCGADTATTEITVLAPPMAGILSGADSVCQGDTIQLGSSVSGGAWSSLNETIATVATDGIVTGVAPGMVTLRYIVTNACGEDTATVNVYVKSTEACATSVRESLVSTRMNIFPNPNSGSMTVETPVDGILTIHTVDGKEVAKYDIVRPSWSLTLPGNLTAGFYMCRFVGDDGSSHVVRLVYQP